MTFSILLLNGTIIDGSGTPGFQADLGIQDDRIAAIGSLSDAEASVVIDANGMAVTPGFIDMHSHGDYVLPFLPTADSKVHQGITLEVVGNCGSSMAPINADMGSQLLFDQELLVDAVIDWLSFREYLDRLNRGGISVNVAALVGHGTIREKVMGMTDASPSPEQLAQMQNEVRQAMEEGAIGLSTGLIYPPSIYANGDEIAALAQIAGECGGIYTSHIRGEGNTLIEAITEALEVGRQTQIPVQISHLKASGVRNWHKMPEALQLLQEARNEGIDVMADMYAYPASNTSLSSLVPPWVHVGGREQMIARLQDPSVRARIHLEGVDPIDVNGVDWDQIYISSCPSRSDYEGRQLQDIASERKQQPWDAVMDILIETRINADIIEFTMHEENVAMGLKDPFVMICTDATGRAAEGPFSAGKPHPRNYGSFARVLGHYARDMKLFTLEEAVRKMTALPAARLKLKDRGRLRTGCFADIVVFDPQTVNDQATFNLPHQYPSGIEWVLVNGEVVIRKGQHTRATPGRVINY